MKYAKFPFEKIPKGSRVVLYGAGRVGRSMFEQNGVDGYCMITGIVDSNINVNRIFMGGIEIVSPNRLSEIPYDYILLSVSDENFGSVYSWFAGKKDYKDKLIPIDIGEKAELLGSDVVVDDTFHEYISDNRNWEKKVKDYSHYWLGKNDRTNWICGNRPAAELLLKGYKFENPVFHVMNENDEYEGSVSAEALRSLILSCADKIGQWTIASMLNELSVNGINTDFSVNTDNNIFDLYTLFGKRGLDEVVVLENGKVSRLIRRVDFHAIFCQPSLNSDGLYIANRYHLIKQLSFLEYRYNVYSQNGEDGIIAHIFEIIGFKSYYAVEFGAWDGIHLSNIRNLVLKHDMSALFIEGNQEKAKEGIQNYQDFPKVKFAIEYVGINKYKRLDDIFYANNVPSNIDILSIDIDGWDYWVWDSLESYRPRVVIVEFNPSMYRDRVIISPSDEKTRTGSSARAFVELGVQKGYELLCIVGSNLFFCVREEFYKFGDFDNSLEALWPYSGLNSLFSTFDGSVYGDPWKRNGKGVLKSLY